MFTSVWAVFAKLLASKLEGMCQLSVEQIEQLEAHFLLLQRWNRVINLTSIHNPEELIERHYCESIFLGLHLPQGLFKVADVGSGAGFPGIPVAVLRPECFINLLESHQRKAVFLREATRKFGNVAVVAHRAELIAIHYDWMISRAVRTDDLPPLAGSAALLTGAIATPDMPGFEWTERVRLPWGKNRFLWLGRNVSRGTC